MGIFQNILSNLKISFDLKHENLLEEQKKLLALSEKKQELNKTILNQLKTIDEKYQELTQKSEIIISQLDEINKKNTTIQTLLAQKDINTQNQWTKKVMVK